VNIVLSLDYELFFGRSSGSVERSVIDPSAILSRLACRYGAKLVFFVDATWLMRLREDAPRSRELAAVHRRVSRQLEGFVAAGHELQLHLHPHWVDSRWNGHSWQFDLSRYRLQDFDDAEIDRLVRGGAYTLRNLAGGHAATAFRAGGWCIQPFERLRAPLRDAGIRIDSSVYAGGQQFEDGRAHDFSAAPACGRWRFESDPLVRDDSGSFLEVPIASHRVGPSFYWWLAAQRLLRLRRHRPVGDGQPIALQRSDLAHKLLRRSTSVVTLDGAKSSFLESAWRRYRRLGLSDFVVIGHPKALTPGGLRRFEDFLANHRDESFVGFNDYLVELPLAQAA
jgi:hypothetical protein